MEERRDMKEEFVKLLCSTHRLGMKDLIDYLEISGFFEVPCSGGHHLSKEGGLLEHSLNVYYLMKELYEEVLGNDVEISSNALIITGLLHDLGKNGDYGKPNYVPNMIKDGRPTKAEPEQKYKQSEDKPYKSNPDLLYIPHEVRSVAIAKSYIPLTESEEHAIYYHNGKYTHTGYDLKETPLQMLLHFADMWCSRIIENEEEEEE